MLFFPFLLKTKAFLLLVEKDSCESSPSSSTQQLPRLSQLNLEGKWDTVYIRHDIKTLFFFYSK
jgi:hypothetical protein